jgi:cyclohexyl-isocyanide hydratase
VITAGGVTSGIDFGLSVVADISGEAVAQAVQLGIEYDPNPPFASGHPDRASDAVKAAVAPRYEQARTEFRETLSRQGCMGEAAISPSLLAR